MGTLSIPTVGEANTTADPKVKTALETYNNSLDAENKLKGSSIATSTIESSNIKNETILSEDLALSAKPVRFYTPKIIATEQSRENVAFGTLTTADEIKEVVVAENALVELSYVGLVKCSVGGAGRMAIFIGSNQLKVAGTTIPVVQEATVTETGFQQAVSIPGGLGTGTIGTSYVTTGQTLTTGTSGGVCRIFNLPAATYTFSIQYRATSGNITAKERKLWVTTLG